jgi:hypothetical protein
MLACRRTQRLQDQKNEHSQISEHTRQENAFAKRNGGIGESGPLVCILRPYKHAHSSDPIVMPTDERQLQAEQ